MLIAGLSAANITASVAYNFTPPLTGKHLTHMMQVLKQRFIQAFVSQFSIEAHNIAIQHQLASTMQCQGILVSSCHLNMVLNIISVPLSETIICGLLRTKMPSPICKYVFGRLHADGERFIPEYILAQRR